jgi:hypothetical protein
VDVVQVFLVLEAILLADLVKAALTTRMVVVAVVPVVVTYIAALAVEATMVNDTAAIVVRIQSLD